MGPVITNHIRQFCFSFDESKISENNASYLHRIESKIGRNVNFSAFLNVWREP